MNYSKTLFAVILLFLTSSVFGDAPTVTFTSHFILKVSGLPIEANTQIDAVFNELGEASKVTTLDEDEAVYFYDEFGMVFVTQNNLVREVGVNFNWNGDEKFSSTSFTGTLMIADLKVTENASQEDFEGIEKIQFQCPIQSMCTNTDQTANVKCSVTFEEEEITQVMFLCY